MKIPAAMAAVYREWENCRQFRRGTWRKSEVKERWSMTQWRRRYSSFCIINGHMSFEKCWIGGKAPKIQRSSCTPRWFCETQFWILRSIHRTRIISISNDSGNSHGFHFQTARLRRTSSGRSISLYPSKNGRCSQIIENSIIGMSRHLHSSTTRQMAQIMVQYGRPSRSSWTKSVRLPFGRSVVVMAIWENLFWSTVGRRFPIENACSYTVKKGYSYLCMWMTSNWLEEETKY